MQYKRGYIHFFSVCIVQPAAAPIAAAPEDIDIAGPLPKDLPVEMPADTTISNIDIVADFANINN